MDDRYELNLIIHLFSFFRLDLISKSTHFINSCEKTFNTESQEHFNFSISTK